MIPEGHILRFQTEYLLTLWKQGDNYPSILRSYIYNHNNTAFPEKLSKYYERRLRLFGIACYRSVPEIHPKENSEVAGPYILYYLFNKALPLSEKHADSYTESDLDKKWNITQECFSVIGEVRRLRPEEYPNVSLYNQILYWLLGQDSEYPYVSTEPFTSVVTFIQNIFNQLRHIDALDLHIRWPLEQPRQLRPYKDLQTSIQNITNRHAEILANFAAPEWEFNPDYRTTTTVSLAKQFYQTGDQGIIPILADALQDSGCDQFYLDRLREHPEYWYKGNLLCEWLIGNYEPEVKIDPQLGRIGLDAYFQQRMKR